MVSRATNLVCDNDVLRAHGLYARYHSSLHDISLKDYPRDNYFRTDIDGIDIDQYEIDRAIADRDKSMDAMVGVADYIGNHVVNSRLLLVELRMDYDSTAHLRASKLKGKVNHSRTAVGASVRVDDENVFVFRDDVAEQAKKWVFSMSKEHSEAKSWVAVSPEELDNMLKSQADMPYQPITDMDLVKKDLINKIFAKDFDAVLESVDYWHNRAEQYKLRYLLKEEQHIKNHLHDTWQQTKMLRSVLNAEQQAYIDFIEEEYGFLK